MWNSAWNRVKSHAVRNQSQFLFSLSVSLICGKVNNFNIMSRYFPWQCFLKGEKKKGPTIVMQNLLSPHTRASTHSLSLSLTHFGCRTHAQELSVTVLLHRCHVPVPLLKVVYFAQCDLPENAHPVVRFCPLWSSAIIILTRTSLGGGVHQCTHTFFRLVAGSVTVDELASKSELPSLALTLSFLAFVGFAVGRN
jgi:hypothetical protein